MRFSLARHTIKRQFSLKNVRQTTNVRPTTGSNNYIPPNFPVNIVTDEEEVKVLRDTEIEESNSIDSEDGP